LTPHNSRLHPAVPPRREATHMSAHQETGSKSTKNPGLEILAPVQSRTHILWIRIGTGPNISRTRIRPVPAPQPLPASPGHKSTLQPELEILDPVRSRTHIFRIRLRSGPNISRPGSGRFPSHTHCQPALATNPQWIRVLKFWIRCEAEPRYSGSGSAPDPTFQDSDPTGSRATTIDRQTWPQIHTQSGS
jgi:hypothetical protein